MYILRMKDKNGIQTLPFVTEKGAFDGADWVMKTTAAGFVAEAEDVNSTHGKILKQWDHSTRWGSSLHYTVSSGAYKDTITATLGTEMDCLAMASQCNENCQGWWCRRAHVEHLVGPLWRTVFTDPYLD